MSTSDDKYTHCRKGGIYGCDKEETTAYACLKPHDHWGRVFFLAPKGDSLFGQCNFKEEPEDPGDLKILARFELVYRYAFLTKFTTKYGITHLILADEELAKEFDRNDEWRRMKHMVHMVSPRCGDKCVVEKKSWIETLGGLFGKQG